MHDDQHNFAIISACYQYAKFKKKLKKKFVVNGAGELLQWPA